MEKQWSVLDTTPQSFLNEHPELPPIVATLLFHRNLLQQKDIDIFLGPDYSRDVHDPYLFQHMEKAVARINTAMTNNEHITVHGDYDADGVSGATILTTMFRALGYENTDIYIPHRETEGYGLNMKTVEHLHALGTNLIITCDCGISNTPEVALANELGVDVIITDHHSIPEILPAAVAIIHPKIDGEPYPDKTLAGGAVAFKVLQAMFKKHAETHETLPSGEAHASAEKWLLDMVAIATVADMVPLLGESRTLTKYGLIVMNKAKRIGLRKLLMEAGIMHNDGSLKYPITEETIGFRIAPWINAAGRIDHANVAYNLFTTTSPTEAVDLAYKLNQNNIERQAMTEMYVAEATRQVELEQMDAPVLFVFHESWNPGVVGLVASRIKSLYDKPVIAMTSNDSGVMGSGRSMEGFNMIEAIQSIPEYFDKFGGHPMACGFTLASPEKKEGFQQALTNIFVKKTEDMDLSPKLMIDAEIDLDNISWDLYDLLEKFSPFGQANPKPLYLAKDVVIFSLQPIGKTHGHLKMVLQHHSKKMHKAIGWGLADATRGDGNDWSKVLKAGDHVDIVCEVGINEWNGNRELQLTITDIRKAENA
ncbi:MAG: single-stranded-DNA-specific exonuclease RecJ [Candidatus Magasanikbacteria bacterium CG_4_9_14_0_2_um_filter_41_10]|uniref:Single-stranded-DNA-specific exonuclease RecJ n=1 Tax=Candidatus Magasanikbacteria bacterium CG_4_10_14_0_2_um_filter_41_31 TaxID=1974639 RepID=A0A2M7V327_9BACT|nr:MAG: single-stranded-DNA-specific exonuclease RecJ [Candidatus Magasanikbacteria bacterium CG1_02_41_34]PIZ92870.1 MAG: single-stranded-DNA-specific exonuclease RecJ [Candidatus Magasanikbacteria bacterium CG_4_10_14_0_2_um_filter_41_31]PJC53185.1 MAG: single-stranded-DNA-specific exonuclease RecJ [Candidatus Magasanikbacteria bacterium CG_4_9_14_0_2_um_filter_41_10]